MFDAIKDLWDNKGFEILVGLSISLILLLTLYHKITGKKGTWSNDIPYYTTPTKPQFTVYQKDTKDSKGEIECRRVLHNWLKKPFFKDRPEFLKNNVTGGRFNLELDCYNEELGLAVEYNGAQHYKHIPYFHKNKEAFLNQKYRDDMKRRLCIDNGIVLIEVPYTVPINKIEGFLLHHLQKNKFL